MTDQNKLTTTRRVRRGLATTAFALLAAGSMATASVWLGAAPSAQADPGDTVVPIGSSQLVQSEDLQSIQVGLDRATVTVGRDADFSSCLGEGNRWTEVLHGSPKPVSVEWTRRGDDRSSVSESIAQAATPAKAKQYAATLVKKGITACRSPQFDFHYGPTQSSRVGSGSATWALSYTGDERQPDGGVVVIRKGGTFGFLQVDGTWGPADQTLESVAKVAVSGLR